MDWLETLKTPDVDPWQVQADILFHLIVVAWCVHLVNWAFCNGGLNQVFGIRPREFVGLFGIFAAPFLHGFKRYASDNQRNAHLFSNTGAFAVLGWGILLQGTDIFYAVSLFVAICGGLLTWLFGQGGKPHVGASGVIFGYFGFLLVYGIVSGRILAFFLACAAFGCYQRLLKLLLPVPGSPRTSWEGHLFGFFSGIFAAFFLNNLQLNG